MRRGGSSSGYSPYQRTRSVIARAWARVLSGALLRHLTMLSRSRHPLHGLQRVPELRLDIVGSGPEGPRLRTLAQALAITERVRWYGEYPDEDLPRRMADADFLVLPSVTVEEMFGLVVLEAMASSRPVITTALPSAVREVNVPGETGLEVPLRDVGALAQALETLARDPVLRKRMGEAGRKRVAGKFTQAAMAEKHIALYERIRTKRK